MFNCEKNDEYWWVKGAARIGVPVVISDLMGRFQGMKMIQGFCAAAGAMRR
jgi:hypothetical protein